MRPANYRRLLEIAALFTMLAVVAASAAFGYLLGSS